MVACAANTASRVFPNARRSASGICALRLDWRRFDDSLDHARSIHTF